MCEAQLGGLGSRDFYCLEGHTSVSKGHDNKQRYAGATSLAQAVSPFLLYLLLFSFKDAEKETHCTALLPGMNKKVQIQ